MTIDLPKRAFIFHIPRFLIDLRLDPSQRFVFFFCIIEQQYGSRNNTFDINGYSFLPVHGR